MGRWKPNSGGRLQEAAYELYRDQGYERTTVAEIAARAELTERTFFRHFADKREVLFAGAKELEALFVDTVLEAPAEAGPLEAVAASLVVVGEQFEDGRASSRLRQDIIAANPELQERELMKMATLGASLAAALRARGVADLTATLTAETGIAIFRIVFDRWIEPSNTQTFVDLVHAALAELRVVAA